MTRHDDPRPGTTTEPEPVPPAIQAYLDDLARRLPPAADRDRILDEARDHLLDAVACELACGTPEPTAVRRALARFGSARQVARAFDPRPRWRTLGEGLVQLTFRRKAVSQPRERRCSFCSKGQSQVKRMIAGPNDVQICDECVALCNQIIHKAEGEAAPAPA